jgi:hypothetical protein
MVKMDGLLTQFKGAKNISITDPPFRPMSQVAMRNRYAAVPMKWDESHRSFVHVELQPDPAFGIRPDIRITEHPEDDGTLNFRNGYDSDEDPEVAIRKETFRLASLDTLSSEEAKLICNSRHI